MKPKYLLPLAILILPQVLTLNTAKADPITGTAQTIDGDTLKIGNAYVRLWGMDAPERAQTCKKANGTSYRCGLSALAVMRNLTKNHTTTCIPRYRDRYRRWVSTCRAAGRDLGETMVALGWALDYPRYSHHYYRNQQNQAAAAHKGMHQGTFDTPEEWRRTHPR